MRQTLSILLLLVLGACANQQVVAPVKSAPSDVTPAPEPQIATPPVDARPSALAEARRGFVTKVTRAAPAGEPAPTPPPSVFRLVHYDAPPGKFAAYLSPDPGDGRKHPAIVWITGGDCNSIGEVWEPHPRNNEQSASAYRKAGIIMMFPSLRGGNDNPGVREGFYGEVDDVIAASEFLAREPYVDPQRIYLGGHSTGGTLVLLVAEVSDRFRATFSFGPTDDPRGYPKQYFVDDRSNTKEMELRTPANWLDSVRRPLFVLEGTEPPVSNVADLYLMSGISANPLIRFLAVKGFDHFSVLAPVNELIAGKILRDEGPTTNIAISDAELRELRARR
jgi:dipeptidyl aminopeptidase/acylaminoacyl peptidase